MGEIPEVMIKSTRSGSLLVSVGQYVGVPVDKKELLLAWITFASSRPLVVVSLDPYSVCLLLKSPPAKKLGPSVRKKVSK